jgi:hypothetical protein
MILLQLKKQIWKILRKLGLGMLVLQFHPNSILVKEGWFRSFQSGKAINLAGEPIPWCTYPYIHFIEPRLRADFRVFEYGAGNSTLWFAKRVKEVVSVESDERWFSMIFDNIPPNVRLIFRNLNNGYVDEIEHHGLFDIIVIDGGKRVECMEFAWKALKSEGIIVWDNSDRDDFLAGIKFLRMHGFRELAFFGMTPIFFYRSKTSIIYRELNCLGI